MSLFDEAGRVKVSASRIKAWLGCPLRWKTVYHDGVPHTVTPAMAFGTAVHRALEVFHRRRGEGGEFGIEVLEAAFWEALTAEIRVNEIVLGEDEPDRMREQARGLIELYVERYLDERSRGVELRLTAPVVDPSTGEDLGADLTGILDLVTTSGLVVDLKTSARGSSEFLSTISHQMQLDAYRYLLDHAAPGVVPTGLEVRTLVRTKTPRIDVQPIPIRPGYGALISVVRRYVDACLQLEDHPSPSFLCGESCPAIDVCRKVHGLLAS